jgi:hypothetical protein
MLFQWTREVWRFLDWYIAERDDRSLHTEPEKAPCQSELSRKMEGNSETARIADRRITNQPSLPTPAHEARAGDPGFGTVTYFLVFPALTCRATFNRPCGALILESDAHPDPCGTIISLAPFPGTDVPGYCQSPLHHPSARPAHAARAGEPGTSILSRALQTA